MSRDQLSTGSTDQVVEDELTRACCFKTTRLDVAEWHNAPLPAGSTLADVLAGMLTMTTTRSLPPDWRGDYNRARSSSWIRQRDAESATLMVMDRDTAAPIGLMVLFETPCDDSSERVDIRLGYLLAESAWGKGLGTELVAGFVEWCGSVSRVRSISGGVALGNTASAKVLIRNGFAAVGPSVEGEQLYELVLTARHD